MFKTLGLAALASVVALVLGFGGHLGTAPKAHADTTDVVVVACENIAGLIDGDSSNAVSGLDIRTACGGDLPFTHVVGYGTELPATGARSIKSLANAIGNEDGILTASDFRGEFDENWDQNQISTDCTKAASNTLLGEVLAPSLGAGFGAVADAGSGLACTLDVFVFVNHDQPTSMDLPTGLKSIESVSLAATIALPVNLDFTCLRDDRALEGQTIGTVGTTTSSTTVLVPTIAGTTGVVGASPITVTTTAATTLVTGDTVLIAGALDPNANGTFVVTVLTSTTFTIPANATNVAAGAGGSITQLNNAPIVTATPHGLAIGDVVTISGSSDATLGGTTLAPAQWRVNRIIDNVTFTVGNGLLNGGADRVAPAAASTGATVVRDWAVGSDNDCNGGQNSLGVANNGDGVVMFHILEDTASRGDVKNVTVEQDAVPQTFDVNVVGSPNNVELTLAEKVIETNGNPANVLDCITNTPVTAGIAPPTSTVAWAVATDQDNTVLTRIPVYFKVTPPEDAEIAKVGIGNAPEEITSNTFFTLHPKTAGLPTAAYVVLCGGKETGPATVDASINLVSCGVTCVVLGSKDHSTQTLTVGGAPSSNVLTAEASAIKCDGSEKSTVTAKVTDSAGNNVADGVPVNFSVVALGTANPINTVTKDGKATSVITPLSNSSAGVTVIVSAGDSGIAAVVQTSVRVDCSLPLATQPTLAPAPVATPRGGIGGPDTGNGGYLNQNSSNSFPMWAVLALVLGSVTLVAGGMVTRRAGK